MVTLKEMQFFLMERVPDPDEPSLCDDCPELQAGREAVAVVEKLVVELTCLCDGYEARTGHRSIRADAFLRELGVDHE